MTPSLTPNSFTRDKNHPGPHLQYPEVKIRPYQVKLLVYTLGGIFRPKWGLWLWPGGCDRPARWEGLWWVLNPLQLGGDGARESIELPQLQTEPASLPMYQRLLCWAKLERPQRREPNDPPASLAYRPQQHAGNGALFHEDSVSTPRRSESRARETRAPAHHPHPRPSRSRRPTDIYFRTAASGLCRAQPLEGSSKVPSCLGGFQSMASPEVMGVSARAQVRA